MNDLIKTIYIHIKISNKGDDDVAMCKLDSKGQGTVEHYYNPINPKSSVYLRSSNKTIGFSNIKVSVVNGQVICSFRRKKSHPYVENYFDVETNPNYYILTASGSISKGDN